MKKRIIVGALLAAAGLALGSAASAAEAPPEGNYSFRFSGQCADCTGFGIATLDVQNYTLGTQLTDANLVDFTYTSNLTQLEITPALDFLDADTLSGSITTAPGPYNIDVAQNFLGFLTTEEFISSTDGTWSASQNEIDLDHGSKGTWNGSAVSAAPEPSTWLLMFAGVGGIGLMLRRAKKTMAFRFKDAFSA